MKSLITVVFFIFLTACGSKITGHSSIEGKYTSIDGKNSYVFTSSGKVQTINFGTPKETMYIFSDKDKTFNYQFDGGMPQTVVVNADGSLTTNTGTKYKKN